MERTIKNTGIDIYMATKDVVIFLLSSMVAISVGSIFYSIERGDQRAQILEEKKRDLQNAYNHVTIHNEEDLKVDSNGTVVRVAD